MDRRSFCKLLAGTVTGTGIHAITAAEKKPALQKSSLSDAPPSGVLLSRGLAREYRQSA